MSTDRYCDTPEPHDMHEWTVYNEWDGHSFSSTFRCYGVRDTPEIRAAIATRDEHRAGLFKVEQDLAVVAHANQRTEAEALNYGPES